ncbi:hypothetical protein [Nitrospina gracilis]|uniref:hypothetical protein n=1 Tax=Nitrospina gracilis TaxID=35801 RepID=UPI001F3F07F4|nr:hypothetical protein [Nitrospina gracilis]MCF8719255.1 RNA polymerase subunit RPABC4/transcription elongation factor Spt4 [Nitrospina gracilis Nb-211]
MALKRCDCGKAYAADRVQKCPFCKRPNLDFPSWGNKIKKDHQQRVEQIEKRQASKKSNKIACSVCGEDIYRFSKSCPECGAEIKQLSTLSAIGITLGMGGAFVTMIFGLLFLAAAAFFTYFVFKFIIIFGSS